ncbi:Mannonate dehydratase [Pseudorhizobium banfieldiae]|uniref:Mannonate dehydratase n=1 Tax=Pseudorhizobium banfieldiae TaxID=1125847 RepID=L0NIZ0_9HYPH|nr:mannonate dehydratase [Pseudorhizobium banfieldiae]CAD6617492.1 mannonate dehydratase [arsenite-oxidising bacterium NT-25]CCF20781.1 Mannonate dehydratase [Pseudorhizobium banfieldiae]
MRQTWRWFGPKDRVSIDDMMQAGVEGVVSALHHVPTGTAWRLQDIEARQLEIGRMKDGSSSGLAWEVVESIPVSEDIKRQTGDWKAHVRAWKTTLENLNSAGIQTICYNFMPVLDWTRTALAHRLPNGATCMRFDLIDFAAFDIHILCRKGAVESFPEDIGELAKERFAQMSEERKHELARDVVFGLPGAAENFSLDDVRTHLSLYAEISEDRLRQHLIDFLSEVAPVAESLGMRLCCHPDDPPFSLLGLPRVMSTEAHYRAVLDAVNLPSNGATLCSGSLGTRPDNDLPGMMERLGDRVHFLHLRNVTRESGGLIGSFYEAEHLGGGTDMVALIAAVLRQEAKRRQAGRLDVSIPFRPDHGQDILDDLGRSAQPGYPAIGRLKGLAELRGILTALSHPVEGIRD